MHTEDDLRATFSALEHHAPDAAGTLEGLDRLRGRRAARRRVTVMAAVAVVTLALAAGSLAVPKLFRDGAPATQVQARDRTPLEFRFAVEAIPGFTTYYHGASSTTLPDSAKVYATPNNQPPDTNAQPYELDVFQAGKYDPAAARAGEPVEVRGKPGFYRPDMPCHCSGQSPISGLAWEWAPNTWALVQFNNRENFSVAEVKANLIRIASAVQLDKTTPVRVPFRIGWLPDGLRLAEGDMFTWDPARAGANLGFAPTTAEGPGLAVGLFYAGQQSKLPVGEPKVRRDTPMGTIALVNVGPFEIQLSSRGTKVAAPGSPGPGPGLSDEELVRIARSITPVGQVLDKSTWIPAVEALPAA